MKPELTRRKILGGVASLGVLGAGVTAQTGLDGASVSGDVDVQAEQALVVSDVELDGSGDADTSFSRVSDDNTEYQVAVELNNGDAFEVEQTIENRSSSVLPVQFNIECSDQLIVDIPNGNATQSGSNTFVTSVEAGDNPTFNLDVELADTADPGAYDVSVAINPLSGGDS